MNEGFAYLQAKAQRYLKLGPEKYRKADHFHMPPEDLDGEDLEAVRSGFQQVANGRGRTAETALEGLGISGFYAMMSIAHFGLEQQSMIVLPDGMMLDRMAMQHRVDPDIKVVLFNKVQPA